jgi:hypothetical protein
VLRAHTWGEAGARTSCIRRRDLSPHRARSYPWPCRFSASSNESCLSSILLSRKAYYVRQLLVASSPRHIHNIANTSRYLSWPNLARRNDHSLGNPLACRVEAAAAALNVPSYQTRAEASSSPASKETKNIALFHGFHREFRMLWGMCARDSAGGSSRSSRSIDLNNESYSGPTTEERLDRFLSPELFFAKMIFH